MGMGLIVPPLLLSLFEVPFLGRLGIIVVCVCTRQHSIIGEMSCLYV